MIEFAADHFAAVVLTRLAETEHSARWLARQAGVSPSTITRLTQGATIDLSTFVAICNAINADPADFFRLMQNAGSSDKGRYAADRGDDA